MPQPLFSPGKDPVPTEQEAGWAPGTVWTGAENLAPNEIRSPDRRAPSQSLYRLRYPAYHIIINENYLYHFFPITALHHSKTYTRHKNHPSFK
jgi:hypothetical protein